MQRPFLWCTASVLVALGVVGSGAAADVVTDGAARGEQDVSTETDSYGDRLPEGAVLRLGTLRFRHRSFPQCIAFSPGGRMVASAASNQDMGVYLWDARTARLIHHLKDPELRWGWTEAIAFSPDGATLASARIDGAVLLWDVEAGALLFRAKGHDEWAKSVAFSPDGSRVASGGGDARVCLWDAADGTKLSVFETGVKTTRSAYSAPSGVKALAFSPDGKLLAAGVGDDTRIFTWDVQACEPGTHIEKPHGESLLSLGFTPDGKHLISSGFRRIPREEFGADFHAKNVQVPEVRFWDVATGELLRELETEEPEAGFGLMTMSADGNTLALGMNQAIRIWDVPSGSSPRTISNPGWSGYQALAISPDGQTVAASIGYAIGLWEVATGQPVLQDFHAHRGWITFAAYTPDQKCFITTGEQGLVMAWDAHTGRQLYQRSLGPDSTVYVAALSADGQIVAAAGRFDGNRSNKNVVRLWRADSGEPIRSFGGPDGPYRNVHHLAFSPDGKLLAIAAEITHTSYDEVNVCDVASGETVAEMRLEEDRSRVAAMAFSPDSKSLFAAYAEAMLHVWDVAEAKVQRSFVPHLSAAGGKADPKQRLWISEAVFSPDARWLITSQDESLVVWEVATGKALWTVPTSENDRSPYLGLSPDGRLLATSKRLDPKKPDDVEINLYAIDPETGNIRLWNPDPGWSDRACDSGDGRAIALAFSPDNKRLMTGMDRGTILVWDLSSATGGQ